MEFRVMRDFPLIIKNLLPVSYILEYKDIAFIKSIGLLFFCQNSERTFFFVDMYYQFTASLSMLKATRNGTVKYT